jgi:tetratricopeptide (TPR) repeat protein
MPAGADIVVYYQFQHALIRETLYEDLRPLRRRQLHRRIAAAMAKLALVTPLPNPVVLARHFIDGAEDEKAVPYLRQAGERAYQVYANNEVIEYLSQACDILEDIAPDLSGESYQANLREQFELFSRQRDVCNMVGDREREFAVLRRLQELAELLADKRLWVDVMCRLSTYYWHVGDLKQAEDTARRALKMARQNSNRPGERAALERISRVLWTQRDPHSMEYATQALALAQILNDRPREGRLTELVGHIFADTLYDPRRAALYFNQALEICRETKNHYEEAWTVWGLGGLAMLVNDYPTALARYDEAKKLSEGIGATLQVGWDLYHMGDAWYNLGNYEQSLDCYQQAQLIFNTSHHPRGRIYVLISTGLALTALGQLNNAQAQFEQAIRQAEERNDARLMLRGYEALFAYYYMLGDEGNLANGIRQSNRIIKLAVETRYPEHELLGYHLRGKGFFKLKNLEEAFKSSNMAVTRLAYFTYIESRQISMAEIYYTHSQIAAALGQLDTAKGYLQKARDETVRKLGMISDEQLRHDFLDRVPVNREIITATHMV